VLLWSQGMKPAARLLPLSLLGFVLLAGPGARAANPAAADAKRDYPGQKEFIACKKVHPGKVLKLNLKPDSEISDLIKWISTVSCTPFVIPSTVSVQGRKVTVLSPGLMTMAEAYKLFYAALDSVNLTVQPDGKYLFIVEAKPPR
jgi:hypothetical protein